MIFHNVKFVPSVTINNWSGPKSYLLLTYIIQLRCVFFNFCLKVVLNSCRQTFMLSQTSSTKHWYGCLHLLHIHLKHIQKIFTDKICLWQSGLSVHSVLKVLPNWTELEGGCLKWEEVWGFRYNPYKCFVCWCVDLHLLNYMS